MRDFDFFNSRYQYHPLTGDLTIKVETNCHGGKKPAGSLVGHTNDGRRLLNVNHGGKLKTYKVHRIAWLLMTGEWPAGEIDHIDTNALNNRWTNLRLATRSQNCMNRHHQTNNTSGFKGVTKHGSNWRSIIWLNGRPMRLGTYRTREEAHAAYSKASAEIHKEFGRTS